MINVLEYNNLENLKPLQTIWSELHSQTRNASFFQSFEWLNQYMIQHKDKIKLKVLTISLGGKIIGIVPLVIKPVKTGLGTVKSLTYPLDSWGVHYSVIGPNPAATLAAATRYLESAKRDWDIMDLKYIDEFGVDVGRTKNALKLSGFQRFQRAWSESSLMKMGKNWDEVWNSLPSETIQEYEKADAFLTKRGEVQFHRFRPDKSMVNQQDKQWEIFTQFERMARLIHGFRLGLREEKALEKDWAFLRCVHEEAVQNGCLDLCWLTQNHQVIAVSYNYHHRGRFDSLGTVYSPSVGPEAACVLMGRMLEDGFHRYDLAYYLNPDHACLDLNWGNSIASSFRYSHFPLLSVRSQLLRMYQWAFHREEGHHSGLDAEVMPASLENPRPKKVKQDQSPFKVIG